MVRNRKAHGKFFLLAIIRRTCDIKILIGLQQIDVIAVELLLIYQFAINLINQYF